VTADVQDGYLRCRRIARAHARSFYAAAFCLDPVRRRAAMALYAFCRRLDDLVDEPGRQDARAIAARLHETRRFVRALGSGRTAPVALAPWHPHELAALGDAIARHGVPLEPLLALVAGVEMDLVKTRYASFAELDTYCHLVAGTVGMMLVPVLGNGDPAALPYADALGRAMQLTNILRDVAEDLARDRLYLPLDELAAAGIGEDDLRAGRVDARFRAFMHAQIARARAGYERALPGIRHLAGRSRLAVALMAVFYRDILRVIEERDCDVFRARAVVPGRRKLALAAATVWRGRDAA
jgi:phytoene synthase